MLKTVYKIFLQFDSKKYISDIFFFLTLYAIQYQRYAMNELLYAF